MDSARGDHVTPGALCAINSRSLLLCLLGGLAGHLRIRLQSVAREGRGNVHVTCGVLG